MVVPVVEAWVIIIHPSSVHIHEMLTELNFTELCNYDLQNTEHYM